MKLKRVIAAAAIAGGLGASALGLGSGLAAADPPHPGHGHGWEQPRRPDIRPQDRDGYYRAPQDHRPFQYQGQWVNPVFDNGHRAWGFWLGPIWIPLV